jgi:tetratricopeptide (TPR) repeat protein
MSTRSPVGVGGAAREPVQMHKTIACRLFPAFALVFAFAGSPAMAGYEYGEDGVSLSGSYLAGRYAGKLRDVDVAARYFEEALRDDPNNVVLIERVFVFALSEGDINAAEEYATRVLSFNSQHRMARIVLGLRDLRLKRYAEAREHFRKSSYTPIGELTSALLTAWSYAAEGNQKEALKTLDQLDTNDAFVNFKAFHAALIADYLGLPLKAENFYKKAYEQAGTSLRVVQAYGNFLERTQRKEEARKIYNLFLSSADHNPLIRQALADVDANRTVKAFVSTPMAGVGEGLFSIASALSDDQGIDVAVMYAHLALSVDSNRDIALTLLGDLYEDMDNYPRAMAAYEGIAPTSLLKANAEIEVAVNLQKLDRSDEAKGRLKALIAKDPRNSDAITTLGNIYRNNQEFAEAAETYSKAIALLTLPTRNDWSAFYYRGIAYERTKQWDKAEGDFRHALSLAPDQPMVLNYLGYSMIEKKINLLEAMEMVRKAVELKPNDGYIVDSLGWAHYQLGEYEDAVKELERAVELKPADPIIADHLGDAYWRTGRQLEARFQWQHAKDNKPEGVDLARIEKKLKEGLAEDAPLIPVENKTNQTKG